MKSIVIFGGAGFIGKCLVSELSKYPCKIFVVTRKPNNHEELRILAGLGQITIVKLEEYNEDNLTELLSGCDIVINLIGILAEQRGSSFKYVHEILPNLLSKISKDEKKDDKDLLLQKHKDKYLNYRKNWRDFPKMAISKKLYGEDL